MFLGSFKIGTSPTGFVQGKNTVFVARWMKETRHRSASILLLAGSFHPATVPPAGNQIETAIPNRYISDRGQKPENTWPIRCVCRRQKPAGQPFHSCPPAENDSTRFQSKECVMRIITLAVLFGCLVCLLPAGPAAASEINMYALDASGQPAPAGSYAWNIAILTRAQWESLDASGKAQYNLHATFCGVEYFMTGYHKKWLDAHGESNHEIVIRDRGADGSLVTICQ